MSDVRRPASSPAGGMSPGLQAGTAVLMLVAFLVLATLISGVGDGLFLLVHHFVTVPSRCAPADPVFGPPPDICSTSSTVQSIVWTDGVIYGLAVLAWLAAIIKQGMSKTEGNA